MTETGTLSEQLTTEVPSPKNEMQGWANFFVGGPNEKIKCQVGQLNLL
jgi:hypothetical protein